ncbi:MAG TPA: heterodisulfide reductase-related iron-sulfur binding cluster [Gammaproteobacteria bacterium]|nr:heterodisulfide reductase-related iron-sulfur binding cluster [Gammaproteobacteria bacterium]
MSEDNSREGGLVAPTRHPIDWRNPEFYNEEALIGEMERIFDICHGCRRCFNLCNSFPTLFDAIDESETMELDSVDRKVYWEVVDHCYLCDMCYMSKCPYVPPHPWNVDFPHTMLRAKAFKRQNQGTSFRDRTLSSTDVMGKFAGIPIVAETVNAVNNNGIARKALHKTFGVHQDAVLPKFHGKTLRKRLKNREEPALTVEPAGGTTGKVALFTTCYGNYNRPEMGEDLIAVFEHNGIPVRLAPQENCCGMPKLELGDLESVEKLKQGNIPVLARLVDEGYDIVAPVPSCVLMFKHELPSLFPDDPDVIKVRDATYDPFEYLMLRHKVGKLNTDFKNPLGKVAYHVPCHLRVQNIGLKTRDLLQLVPDSDIQPIERCSGHDGTYAVKAEFHETSMKIGKPVVNRVKKAEATHYASDCPMAGDQIMNGLQSGEKPAHPLGLLRKAYGI